MTLCLRAPANNVNRVRIRIVRLVVNRNVGLLLSGIRARRVAQRIGRRASVNGTQAISCDTRERIALLIRRLRGYLRDVG